MRVLVFGNPLVEEDNLAVKLIPKLKEEFSGVEFLHIDPTEELGEFGEDLFILDVVHGIEKPIVLEDPEKLSLHNVTSMHDFDLAYNLKLLMQVGKIKKVKILGLPYDMEEEAAFEWVKSQI